MLFRDGSRRRPAKVGCPGRTRGARWRPAVEGLEGGLPLAGAVPGVPPPAADSPPVVITAGPDGNLWFTYSLTKSIGRIDPTTHAIAEFPLSATGSKSYAPQLLTAGPGEDISFFERAESGTGGEV